MKLLASEAAENDNPTIIPTLKRPWVKKERSFALDEIEGTVVN